MGRAGARAREGKRSTKLWPWCLSEGSVGGCASVWSSCIPQHWRTLPSPEAVGAMPKQSPDGDPRRKTWRRPVASGIGIPTALTCPQAGHLLPGAAHQVWRNVKWQNHSPGGLHRWRHPPVPHGWCEQSWEQARRGLQHRSPAQSPPCLGRQGQISAMMGCPVPVPFSGLTWPLAGTLWWGLTSTAGLDDDHFGFVQQRLAVLVVELLIDGIEGEDVCGLVSALGPTEPSPDPMGHEDQEGAVRGAVLFVICKISHDRSHVLQTSTRKEHQESQPPAAGRSHCHQVPESPSTSTPKEGPCATSGASGSCFVQPFTSEDKLRWMSTT